MRGPARGGVGRAYVRLDSGMAGMSGRPGGQRVVLVPGARFADHFSSMRPNRQTASATSQDSTNSATMP